jgi:hypothetical protein
VVEDSESSEQDQVQNRLVLVQTKADGTVLVWSSGYTIRIYSILCLYLGNERMNREVFGKNRDESI